MSKEGEEEVAGRSAPSDLQQDSGNQNGEEVVPDDNVPSEYGTKLTIEENGERHILVGFLYFV